MTLKEFARELNLSYSTVSAVLRGRGDELHISQATSERVRKAVKELNYRPNLTARALRNNRSYNIGILLPSPRDPFYAEMVADIQHRLAASEYVGIFAHWENNQEVKTAVDNILKYNIEGIITNEPGYLPDNLSIPVVTYKIEDPRFDYVGYDETAVLRIALDHLIKSGHRRIAFQGLFGQKAWDDCINDASGYVLTGDYVVPCTIGRPQMSANFIGQKISGTAMPDAIIAVADEVALRVIQWAWKSGLKVPNDLSVISCKSNWTEELATPPLTTIRRTGEPFGTVLLETLFKRLKSPDTARMRYLAVPKLIERSSCAPKK